MKLAIGALVGALTIAATQFTAPSPAHAQSRIDFDKRLALGCRFRIYNESDKKSYWTVDNLEDWVHHIKYAKYPGQSNTPSRQHFYVKPVEARMLDSKEVEEVVDGYSYDYGIFVTIQRSGEGPQTYVTREWGSRNSGYTTQTWLGANHSDIWAQIFAVESHSANKTMIRQTHPQWAAAHYVTGLEDDNYLETLKKSLGQQQTFYFREVGCPELDMSRGGIFRNSGSQHSSWLKGNQLARETDDFQTLVGPESSENAALSTVVGREYLPWTYVDDPDYRAKHGGNQHKAQFKGDPWYIVEQLHTAKVVHSEVIPAGQKTRSTKGEVPFTTVESHRDFLKSVSTVQARYELGTAADIAYDVRNMRNADRKGMERALSFETGDYENTTEVAQHRAKIAFSTIIQLRKQNTPTGFEGGVIDLDATDGIVASFAWVDGYRDLCWAEGEDPAICK
ncbi:MAG: hypothetical protein AAF092_11085 [Pseudomonadota bacterium]